MVVISTVPDSVWPSLANSGVCSRQRTWYHWVRGSVGAVDSHTVELGGAERQTGGRETGRADKRLPAVTCDWSTGGGGL